MAKATATAKAKAKRAPARKGKGKGGGKSRGKDGGKSRGKDGGTGKGKSKGKVKMLAGGNPQIAKADGDAPVRAYIAALPGWKSAVARRLDAIVAKAVPRVKKAVKWNSPFYGIAGQGWFLSMHAFTRYLKLTFFKGTSLDPVPPGTSKHPEVRYLDVHEDDAIDERQLARWCKQAAAIPGWATGKD